jgi:hypothetical protein
MKFQIRLKKTDSPACHMPFRSLASSPDIAPITDRLSNRIQKIDSPAVHNLLATPGTTTNN